MRAFRVGSGVTLPPCVMDNHRLGRVLDTSDPSVRERTGVVTRRFVEPGTSSADLGAPAAKAAIADARIDAAEIDYGVCATMTPDHYFPGCGTLIQQRLGLRPNACATTSRSAATRRRGRSRCAFTRRAKRARPSRGRSWLSQRWAQACIGVAS